MSFLIGNIQFLVCMHNVSRRSISDHLHRETNYNIKNMYYEYTM